MKLNKLHSILLIIIFMSSILSSCKDTFANTDFYEKGITRSLAIFRKTYYQNPHYHLSFRIPEEWDKPVTGSVDIEINLDKIVPVVIDFRAPEKYLTSVGINGKRCRYTFENEHIIIPTKECKKGINRVSICFQSPEQSINRRDEFVYTLLVPDRARTLFPCFDQPDLKSLYNLTLELPESWSAIANSPVVYEDVCSDSNYKQNRIRFDETEPLSTYLFSFVAGKFSKESFQRDNREISIYHRETDPAKIAQCSDIASEVFQALDWLEEYTSIPYPFAKYDLIILPGFQYGGMEHTGATLYNDRRMFLNENPTLNERLNRSALIAHETAHMWFGDYVTMQWFDDVWTKEVFANYFASRIVEPLYPEINHRLNFILDYLPSSYSEDRTAGSNPVKQDLDNLQNAGLVYGNIIYNKSPVVMEMLVQKIGENAFRKGIHEYLTQYAYGNADWEGLVEILDKYTNEDLKSWSQAWIHEKGMPEILFTTKGGEFILSQQDPWNRNLFWPQALQYSLLSQKGIQKIPVNLTSGTDPIPVNIASLTEQTAIIPNSDGRGYGFFSMDQDNAIRCMHVLHTNQDEVLKGSLLITLYENLLNGNLAPELYMQNMLSYIQSENNSLLFSLALSYIEKCQHIFPYEPCSIEDKLWQVIISSPISTHRLQALRSYMAIASTKGAINNLYNIWSTMQPPSGCILSENDYIRLSYILAIHLQEKAGEIVSTQRQRITNPDRIKEYEFISPSVSPYKEVRDSVFISLLQAENRSVEPWASTSLTYLNYRTRQQEAIAYIRPALDILPEVQSTGDIFFPTVWIRALLSGHNSIEARREVEKFLEETPELLPMLTNKVKQQADMLYRIR